MEEMLLQVPAMQMTFTLGNVVSIMLVVITIVGAVFRDKIRSTQHEGKIKQLFRDVDKLREDHEKSENEMKEITKLYNDLNTKMETGFANVLAELKNLEK